MPIHSTLAVVFALMGSTASAQSFGARDLAEGDGNTFFDSFSVAPHPFLRTLTDDTNQRLNGSDCGGSATGEPSKRQRSVSSAGLTNT